MKLNSQLSQYWMMKLKKKWNKKQLKVTRQALFLDHEAKIN